MKQRLRGFSELLRVVIQFQNFQPSNRLKTLQILPKDHPGHFSISFFSKTKGSVPFLALGNKGVCPLCGQTPSDHEIYVVNSVVRLLAFAACNLDGFIGAVIHTAQLIRLNVEAHPLNKHRLTQYLVDHRADLG